MNYFVVMPDGQKYGPADLRLLNQWADEGRILANTMLEEAGTGRMVQASAIPGLRVPGGPTAYAAPNQAFPFPTTQTQQQPTQYANYQRGPASMPFGGQNDLTFAWVFGSLGMLFCVGGTMCSICTLIGLVFPVLGIIYANRAHNQGHPGAITARVFSYVALALQIGGFLFFTLFMSFAMRA